MAKWSVSVELRGKFSGEYEIEADTEDEAEDKATDQALTDAYMGDNVEWDDVEIASAECIDEDGEDDLADEDDLEEGTDA